MGILEELDPLRAATANRGLLAQALRARNKPAFQMKTPTVQGLLDNAALATSPVPILGDLFGLGADVNRYITDPSSRTWGNFGLTGLGLLPFVPPATAIFAGPLAKTAKLDKKALAEGMEKAGRSREDIWKETGWFKGPEGKWKFEIDDSGAGFKNNAISDLKNSNGKTQSQIMSHGELFNSYPDSANLWTGKMGGEYGGQYSPGVMGKSDMISLGIPNKNINQKELMGTNLHEIQHAIQEKEGFAKGGNPFDKSLDGYAIKVAKRINDKYAAMENQIRNSPEYKSFIDDFMVKNPPQISPRSGRTMSQKFNAEVAADSKFLSHLEEARAKEVDAVFSADKNGGAIGGLLGYRSLAGEAEARAVQSRMNMNQLQRQQTPPWQSYDVPWDQLIIK